MQYYVDKNSLSSFTYGAVSSTSFNFIIIEDNHLDSFEKDLELIEVPGRTGDLLIDNNRNKNKDITIEAYADLEGIGSSEIVTNSITQWLSSTVEYKPLKFSKDPKNYEAIVTGSIKIKEEIPGLLSVKFKFNCKEVIS